MEAISPTLPNDDMRQDLSPFKSTKDDLVQNINRIDREITEAETQIAKLRKKQVSSEVADRSVSDQLFISWNWKLLQSHVPMAQMCLNQRPNRSSRVSHNSFIRITGYVVHRWFFVSLIMLLFEQKKAHMTHSLLDRISGVAASSLNLTSLLVSMICVRPNLTLCL